MNLFVGPVQHIIRIDQLSYRSKQTTLLNLPGPALFIKLKIPVL